LKKIGKKILKRKKLPEKYAPKSVQKAYKKDDPGSSSGTLPAHS